MPLVSAGCEMFRRRAARPRLPLVMTGSRLRRWRTSMIDTRRHLGYGGAFIVQKPLDPGFKE